MLNFEGSPETLLELVSPWTEVGVRDQDGRWGETRCPPAERVPWPHWEELMLHCPSRESHPHQTPGSSYTRIWTKWFEEWNDQDVTSVLFPGESGNMRLWPRDHLQTVEQSTLCSPDQGGEKEEGSQQSSPHTPPSPPHPRPPAPPAPSCWAPPALTWPHPLISMTPLLSSPAPKSKNLSIGLSNWKAAEALWSAHEQIFYSRH